MKNVLSCLALILGFITFDALALEPNPSKHDGKLASIDKECRDEFGVGIAGLGLLLEAKPGSFLLEAFLISEGRSATVSQLEKAGLIEVKRVQSAQGTVLQLLPTPKGRMLADALRQLSQ